MTVDLTPPVPGWVKDGLDPNDDIQFGSNPGTVATVFGDFQDPESGIASRDLLVYRQHKGVYLSNYFAIRFLKNLFR